MADEKFLQIKTAVNTRMPLELRTQAVSQAPETVPGSDGTILFPRRHPIKSTYNDTYRHYYIVPGTTMQPGYRGGAAAAATGGVGGSRYPTVGPGASVGGGASYNGAGGSPLVKPTSNNSTSGGGSGNVKPPAAAVVAPAPAAAAAAAPTAPKEEFTLSQQRLAAGGPLAPVSFDEVAKSQFTTQVDAAAEGFVVAEDEGFVKGAAPGGANNSQAQDGGSGTFNNSNGSARRRNVMVSTQRAEYTGAGAVNGPDALDEHLSFYSKVRKQEASDDQARKGLSDLQRTVEVNTKRQTDAAFSPPSFDMENCARNMRLARTAGAAALSTTTGSAGGAGLNGTGGSPSSVGGSPLSTASITGKTARSQSVDTAGRALPLCFTAHGQVRHGTRTMPVDVTTNICCTIPLKPTTQQQEFTLPPPHIPEEIPSEYKVQRRAITEGASGLDLFQGTAKASPVVIPRFMGHVPASERNIAKQQPEGSDILRAHSKRFINIAIPAHLEAGGNGGRTVTERSSSSISQTVMGFYSEQAAHASPSERQLNTRAPKPF